MVSTEQILLGMFAGIEGAHFFSARLPSKMTIKKFVDDDEARQAIVGGIIEATGLSIATSAVVSYLIKSYIPLIIGTVFTGALALMYWNDLATVKQEQTISMTG